MTSEPKHTPEWKTIDHDEDDRLYIHEEGHGCAAVIPLGDREHPWFRRKAEANAQLILSAPKLRASHDRLLEACKAAFEHATHATHDPIARLDQPQLSKLRKAIAMATQPPPAELLRPEELNQ